MANVLNPTDQEYAGRYNNVPIVIQPGEVRRELSRLEADHILRHNKNLVELTDEQYFLGDQKVEGEPSLTCEVCGKNFKNKLGLMGHSRSHK